MIIYLLLFFEFARIGLFAIGGGPATLPYLAELTGRQDWYTSEELSNIIAISESTPGPLGINMATYAGFHAAGVLGGITATLSLAFPSVIVIILIAKYLGNINDRPVVRAAFYGVRPAVTAIIATAVFGLCKATFIVSTDNGTNVRTNLIILSIVLFALMRIKKLSKLHPVVWLLAAAAMGIILKL